MITCPNCQHQNPDGATVCELCFTTLPITSSLTTCPNCGADVPPNATFCGECGFNLVPPSQSDMGEVMDKDSSITDSIPSASIALEKSVVKNETQLQSPCATLLHVQTDLTIELSPDLPVIHLGKPNEKIPPDIDVSGFPNSQIVSRIHADIRQEEGYFYLEDTGSANGTYVNHIPLQKGSRQLLRNGDRIALGKEDKVSFIFNT